MKNLIILLSQWVSYIIYMRYNRPEFIFIENIIELILLATLIIGFSLTTYNRVSEKYKRLCLLASTLGSWWVMYWRAFSYQWPTSISILVVVTPIICGITNYILYKKNNGNDISLIKSIGAYVMIEIGILIIGFMVIYVLYFFI